MDVDGARMKMRKQGICQKMESADAYGGYPHSFFAEINRMSVIHLAIGQLLLLMLDIRQNFR